jgi:LuxR family transcriptional regulator, maltose regulon positive regulatory protein
MTAIGAAAPRALGSHPRSRAAARPESTAALPALAPGLIARDALVERLMDAERASLALLVAPAGSGKTTLLTQWAEQDPRAFAWVPLCRADDDPVELAHSVAHALGAAPERRKRSLDTIAQSLESALARTDEPLVLVLDDAHVLRSPQAFGLIARLVDAAGPGSQVVLSARKQPPFPVARLRTDRRLLELRAPDLMLTRAEVAGVAAAAGLELDVAGYQLLAERTEGWPAGVYLAALALRDEPSPQRALASFGGDDRLVVDYVRDELLGELPATLVEFLARSSVLTRLSGPLCDHVLERQDSGRVLRKLSQMNLLVLPLDRTDTEYRYHPLLAESLRAELRLREPELEPSLHARASEWYERREERDLAVEHALQADDLERAGALLWQATPELLGYGRAATLSQRIANFRREQVAACAPLALAAASAELALGDRALAEHWTATAERALGSSAGEAGLHLLRAAVADDTSAMKREAARVARLAADDSPWRSFACLFEGMALRLEDERAAARARLEEGARRGVALAPAAQTLCLAQLALLAMDEGDWDEAEARAAIARAQVERVGLDDFPLAALVFAASAAVHAHTSRPQASERDARQADRLVAALDGFTPWYGAQCRIALAWAAVRVSDTARARRLLGEAARGLRELPEATAAHASLAACREQTEIASAARAGDAEQLTGAELRVLHFLPTHLSFPEIADELYVSRNTVKTHVRAVYRKLTASSRSEAVHNAREAGLLDELAA